MLKVASITMEYLKNPVGLPGMPWFGWILESDKKNVIQKGYQLQISLDREFEKIQYDSNWVESSESVHVYVKGIKLESLTRYFVRVRVRDQREESVFSDVASFVTAILCREEWQAKFVSAETSKDKSNSKATYLKKEIFLEDEVESAYACTTALGLYHFYMNGKKVGKDEMAPGWTSYHKHLCYQTYDVTNFLKKGRNMLGAMLGAGWYKGKMGFLLLRNNYGTQTAFLMQMKVRYKDGREVWFATDESFLGHDAPITFSEIYDGEEYDARMEIPAWNEIPKNEECVQESWRTAQTVEFPLETLTAQAGCKVTVMDELPAVEVIRTPAGETVIDFGQNLTGWIQFRVRGEEGSLAWLKCFEMLDAQGNVYKENLRSAKQELKYICSGKEEEEYHPYFTFQGFRYAQILSWPCEVECQDFTAYTLHSEMEQTGTFSCSNALVNQLQHNILWGLKGNFLDIPTDCPQRDERMGWTGDAQIFCRTACYLMNTYNFFRKWLVDVAADQTSEGGVPHVIPDIISGREKDDWLLSQGTHSAAAWADVIVINPWTMYLTFGDKNILEKHYTSMKKWIEFMRNHAEGNIWNYRLQFGDWVALDAEEGSYFGATPNDLTCTAYYAYSTGLFAKIAKVLGREEDALEYSLLRDRIVKTFQQTFFQEDGSMTVMTQTAHIIALYFNLVPDCFREQTAAKLVELLKEKSGHLVTGFVGTPYFCHALSQNGYVDEAYQLLLKEDFPSWLYQVKKGATTVWEHWDGLKPDGSMWSPDMNSFNHYAYGAIGEWLYRVVLGIEIDEEQPGYHHVIISPQTGNDFEFAEGSFDSPYGLVAVKWKKSDEKGERILEITIPHNAYATILLERGAKPNEDQEVVFEETERGMEAECGSGQWTVKYHK